jgi:tetratricopeptide (TPR) repeat protein
VTVARKLGPPETVLNDISFGLAEAKEDLGDALAYAQEAVKIEESASSQRHLATMTDADLKNESKLAFFWDTLGWVELRMGHREEAEGYLRAAWLVSQYGVIADHLAQAYDEEKKKDQAIDTYRLALKAFEGHVPLDRQEEIAKRLQELAPGKLFPTRPGEMSLVDRLTEMRTVKVPKPVNTTSSAEFFVAIEPGPKVAEVRFVDGAEELRAADNALSEATYPVEFPSGSAARIVRRGLLDCHDAGDCSFVLLPIDAVTSAK